MKTEVISEKFIYTKSKIENELTVIYQNLCLFIYELSYNDSIFVIKVTELHSFY